MRYLVSEQKSTILVFYDNTPNIWTLNGKSVSVSELATHLGINRDTISNTGVKEVVNGVS